MVSEIAPLMIMTKLEQYQYAEATAIAVVMLLASFASDVRHQRLAALGAAAAEDAIVSQQPHPGQPRGRALLLSVALLYLGDPGRAAVGGGIRRGFREGGAAYLAALPIRTRARPCD